MLTRSETQHGKDLGVCDLEEVNKSHRPRPDNKKAGPRETGPTARSLHFNALNTNDQVAATRQTNNIKHAPYSEESLNTVEERKRVVGYRAHVHSCFRAHSVSGWDLTATSEEDQESRGENGLARFCRCFTDRTQCKTALPAPEQNPHFFPLLFYWTKFSMCGLFKF